jgi:thiamine transport system substrate-binding protein
VQIQNKLIRRAIAGALSVATATIALSGCSFEGSPTKVVIATHDSFVMSDELIAEFESISGYELEILRAGDAGELTNKLVLTKDDPIADAFFGIDNTFIGVANEALIVDGDPTQVDFADVCFNYDRNWFSANKVTPPTTWLELTDPQYRSLTVVQNPATSSTGLAFLLATVGELGDGYLDYWQALADNDLKVAAGWEDAYYGDFSGSAGEGPRPIVLSYSSSPADEVNEDGSSRTAALLEKCFRQYEYAGVLAGAKNVDGARSLVEFMLRDSFQTALPSAMYVYPVRKGIELPDSWAKRAPAATSFVDTSGLDIDANRSDWIKAFSSVVLDR